MRIKEATKFILYNCDKIIKLGDDHYLPALNFLALYKIYIHSKEPKLYESQICKLCDKLKGVLNE